MVIRLLIFVQEVTFADALATRLEAEPDMGVVAALYLRDPLPQLSAASQADVVLLDGDLPGDAAFRLCEELRQRGDTPRIVFLSQISDPRRIAQAIASGAVGWIQKDESLDHLIQVIHGAARGETWLPPSETGAVLRLLMGESDEEDDNDAPLVAALTRREREVLACLAEGTNRTDLAVRLHMSPNTVRTHLQNLMSKLGVHSALEAVALMRAHLDDQLLTKLSNQLGQSFPRRKLREQALGGIPHCFGRVRLLGIQARSGPAFGGACCGSRAR